MTIAESSMLMTGATGFLGQRAIRLWQFDSMPGPVLVGTRRPVDKISLPGVRCVNLDLSDRVALEAGIGTVIHIAGEKRDQARMVEINEYGTRRLVEAAAAAGVRRFVYVSSVGSYGAPAHAGVVTESYPHTPRNLYEASKDAGERHVRAVCAASGMDAVILQPTNVIGRVDGQSAPLLGLMRMVARGRFAWFGPTEPVVNYVGVDDVAAAVVAAARHAPAGTYIVNTPCRLADLVGWVAAERGVAAPTLHLPALAGRLLAGAGAVAAAVTGRSMPFGPERLLELTNTTRYAPQELERATDFVYPSGIEKTVRDLARGYISEDLL